MTVAVGLVCSNGVVVASDSMGSSGNIAQELTKVYALQTLPLIWTAAGTVYAIEEVTADLRELDRKASSDRNLREAFTKPDLDGVRSRLDKCIRPILRRCYETALPLGPRMVLNDGHHAFHTDFLLLGYARGTPYFLEFDGQGQLNWHHETKFYAVGSGGEFASVARGLMQHYLEGPELSLEQGMRLAFRTIETTCDVSSAHVGPPVQLAIADDSAGRVLSKAEVEIVRDAVARWKTLERDTLREELPHPAEAVEEMPTLSDTLPSEGPSE